MNFYLAIVTWYCDDTNKNRHEKNIIAAEDYTTAMVALKKMYGDGLIDVYIKELWVEESSVLHISEDTYRTLAEDYKELNEQ